MPEDETPIEPTLSETPIVQPSTAPEGMPLTEATPEVTPPVNVEPPLTPTLGLDSNAQQKNPKTKKMIIIGAIIVGVLAILGGGTAAAYTLWYQAPQKVVLEAVGSLLQSGTSTHKVSVNVTSSGTTVKLSIDAKLAESPASEADITADVTYQGKDYKVAGSILTDTDGNLYIKLNDVKSLLTQYVGSAIDLSSLNNVMTEIDGKWVKISSDDLKSVSSDYSKTQTCTTTALKSLDEKATTDEILAIYKKNDFIVIGDKIGAKSINGVGSLGYNVTFDKAKVNAFYSALGDTKVGKALTACDSSFDFKPNTTPSTDDSKTTSTIQVWSSRFGHQLTELDVNEKSNDTATTIVWNPTFVKGVTVTAPATSTPLKTVINDFETDLGGLLGTSDSNNSTSFSPSFDGTADQNAFKLSSLL